MSFGAPVWAINSASGEQAITFSSFISLDLRSDGKAVSAPVEEGSFATYNKTESPLEIDVQLGIEGTDGELQAALDKIKKLKAGTGLVTLTSPTAVYKSLTLESYSYAVKRENGIGVLWVDLTFIEVKQVRAEYSSEKLETRKESGKKQPKKSGSGKGGNSAGGQKSTEKNRSFLVISKKAVFG